MTVYEDLNFDDELTDKQIAMLREVAASPAVPDEDCPELTDEQMIKLTEAARKRRQKDQNTQTVTINLSPQAMTKAKSLGRGYTAVLSRILENALADNDTIRHYL